MWHDSLNCNMTCVHVTLVLYLRHNSFTCDVIHSRVTCLNHMCNDEFVYDMSHSRSSVWHDTFVYDMSHSHVTCRSSVWHDAFACAMTQTYVTWLLSTTWIVHTCNMTYLRAWRDSITSKTLMLHMWKKWQTCERLVRMENNDFTCVNKFSFKWQRMMLHMWTS